VTGGGTAGGLTAADLPDALIDAFETARAIPAELLPPLSLADAYALQDELVARHVERGRRPGGWKLGMTNVERGAQFGAAEPTCGVLLEDFVLRPGGPPLSHAFVAPRLEAEFAFVLVEEIDRVPERADLPRLLRAAPALELLDSRTTPFPTTTPPGIADNAAGAGAVLGEAVEWDELDLQALPVRLLRDGEELALARGAAIAHDPAAPVLWLAERVLAAGGRLAAGTVVLTGGVTPAFPLEPGAYAAEFGDLGSVALTVTPVTPDTPGGSLCRLRISLT
jgi:2-keto-4-pentenoate hydratase